MHALRTGKKNDLGDKPIYHFPFNLHFFNAPLAQRLSQAPRHSGTSYAPQEIVNFQCLLDSLLDFYSGACRFCAVGADEAATAATDPIIPRLE